MIGEVRWVSIAAVWMAGCVGAPASGADEAALVGGVPTFDYPEVVYLVGANGTCSGSLIAPDIVLSAAHCQHEVGGTAFVMTFDMPSTVPTSPKFGLIDATTAATRFPTTTSRCCAWRSLLMSSR